MSLPDFCCIAACPLSLRKLLCYFAHQVQPPSCPPWLWPPQVEVSLYGTAAASRVSRPLQQFVHCCNLGFVWRNISGHNMFRAFLWHPLSHILAFAAALWQWPLGALVFLDRVFLFPCSLIGDAVLPFLAHMGKNKTCGAL